MGPSNSCAALFAPRIRPRGSSVKNLGIEDVLIRVLGDVALIHARTTYTKADGQPGGGRYTDVWARRGAGWVCVAANVTRL